jgi:bacterioferritin-associated ferredoxin
MDPDDHVCLCFHVSLRKIRAFLSRENPPVASLISECLSAGTGCMWCVPFLKHLHAQHRAGQTPDLRISPERYASSRLVYKDTKSRDPEVVANATAPTDTPPPPPADGPATSPPTGPAT